MKKKLLILGGAALHCGVVETAKCMGIETYVTDYLPIEDSPAKQIANHAWDYDIFDVDNIVTRCKQESMDGVLNVYIDPCQMPCQEICERLGLPFFATPEQIEIFHDKNIFLETCKANGVDVIEQYYESDFVTCNPDIRYPLYVKPSDSRGTRGQTVCRNYSEMADAIFVAKNESDNGEVIIERFMEGFQDIQLTYFMIDGEPHLYCIGDKYNGTAGEGYQGSVIAGVCPSIHEETILSDAHPKICKMLRNMGLKNTPVFIQGFLEGNKFRAYDPALRLPGFLYEHIIKKATGLDTYKALIEFALTGRFPQELKEVNSKRRMAGKLSVSIWIFVRAGRITEVRGIDELRMNSSVVRIDEWYHVGDVIENWRNIKNTFCEVAMLCEDIKEAKQLTKTIYDTVRINDENGEDMKIVLFDTNRWDDRYQE